MGKIENMKMLARKAREAIDEDWLKDIKEMKQIAVKKRGSFERLPNLDLRGKPKGSFSSGSEEDPEVIRVNFLSDPRKIEGKFGSNYVVDLEVLKSSDEGIEPGKYSVWANTTVLESELENYIKFRESNCIGTRAIIAYYGRVKVKGRQPAYVYRIIPED